MKTYLIVDGYNVIHQLAQNKGKEGFNLEDAREDLVHRLGDYSGYMGYKTVLVFDAYTQEDIENREERRGNITLVFTGKDITADSYIERMVYQLPKMVPVKVVTSDNALQQMVMALGGERISSRELLLAMTQSKKALPKAMAKGEGNHGNRISEHMKEDVFETLERLRRSDEDTL